MFGCAVLDAVLAVCILALMVLSIAAPDAYYGVDDGTCILRDIPWFPDMVRFVSDISEYLFEVAFLPDCVSREGALREDMIALGLFLVLTLGSFPSVAREA